MKNKSYDQGQNRYIEGGTFSGSLQVIDIQEPKKATTGQWTFSTASYYKVTLSKLLPTGEVHLYTIEPSKGSKTWRKWYKVIKEFHKGHIVELTGKFKIASEKHKRTLLSATKSSFTITDTYTEEEYAKGLEMLTGKEIPVQPELFDK